MSTPERLSVTKCGARCLFDHVRLGKMKFEILHSCYFGPRRLPALHGTPVATHRACARTNLPDLQISRGRTPDFMRRRPRWVSRCSVHAPLSKPPHPTPDANGAGMPERKFGFEAMEASAKLRKSSIDCLSAASFEAARSEQLRLPAEGPLKRRDGSSCKNRLTPLSGLVYSTHGTTLFVKEST